MNCSNCGKELKENAKFCGDCGNEVKIERNIKSDSKDFEKEKKEVVSDLKKKTKGKDTLRKILILAIIISIILVISVAIVLLNKKSYTNVQYNSGTFEENVKEEERKKIPEDKKAIVTFVENGVETKEEREVDREKLLSCVNNVIINTSDELRRIGAGVIKYKLLLYYVEYDIVIDNKTTHENEYGVIMHSNVAAQDLRSIYAKNYYYRLVTKFSNDTPMLQVVKMGDTTRNEQFILNDVVVSGEEYFQDIEDSLTNVFGSSCRNIRIGGINAKDNEWVKSIFNTTEQNKEKETEDEEVTANEDYEEMMNSYNENNSNIGNNDSSNTNLGDTPSYDSSVKEETYTAPTINVIDLQLDIWEKETAILEYTLGDRYDDQINVVIKHNDKILKDEAQTVNEYYKYSIQLEEGTNTVQILATNSKGKTTTQTRTKNLTYTAPTINVPNGVPSTTEKETIDLFYFITDDYPKESEKNIKVVIKNNGQIIEETNVMSMTWGKENCIIPLIEGENKIEIIATNSKNKTSTKSYTVIRTTN